MLKRDVRLTDSAQTDTVVNKRHKFASLPPRRLQGRFRDVHGGRRNKEERAKIL